jgi:addiction module RelE/StbE family toxin
VIRGIRATPRFARDPKAWLKSRPSDGPALHSVIQSLGADAFEPSLHTHKLKGKLAGSWSCSVGYDLRIVFDIDQRGAGEEIVLLTLGTHDDVY